MLLAFPIIVLALVVVAALRKTIVYGVDVNLIIAIAIPIVPRVARVVRAAALSVNVMPYIDAARAAGYSDSRIIFRHMAPNVVAPFLIMFTAFIAQAILLEASLSFVQEKLRHREIRVQTSFADTPNIVGDSERLQQLFLNLLLNAADAMPDGGELDVSITPAVEQCVEVRVADTGAGIPPEDRERIFEPFFTTKPAGEGNGLGLMVAHGIVLDHGGTIELADDREQGAEFVLRFPLPD